MVVSARAICDAVAYNKLNIVRFLIRDYGVDVSQTSGGLCPLAIAAQSGILNMVRCLRKECCADVNQANDVGITSL
jgi:hypothetical protein